jgi:hypothetical protein
MFEPLSRAISADDDVVRRTTGRSDMVGDVHGAHRPYHMRGRGGATAHAWPFALLCVGLSKKHPSSPGLKMERRHPGTRKLLRLLAKRYIVMPRWKEMEKDEYEGVSEFYPTGTN